MKNDYTPEKDEILFVPLGGSGEIGGNLNLYGTAGKWLMVDCGVSFGGEKVPGIELKLPDPQFIIDRAADLVGIVITHGHEDHIGALEYVWDKLQCPVYATPFTAALIEARLSEGRSRIRIIERDFSKPWKLGPFGLEFVRVTHSIPDSAMLLIEMAGQRLLHTGDWKFDPEPLVGPASDKKRLREIGDSGVLAVIGDSTNALVNGHTGSEGEVRTSLINVIRQQTGRVAIACFASNLARLHTAAVAARATERELAFIGRSLWRVLKAAENSNYWPYGEPLEPEDAAYLPAERALYVVTGSQGEERSALTRIAQDEHPDIVLGQGDTVIFSAREIPGNEIEIARVQNMLIQRGVKLITADDEMVHVSGHPGRADLTELYQMVRPHMLIPVHGEARHQLAHVELGADCQIGIHFIPQNGHILQINPNSIEVMGQLEAGQLGLDGKRLVRMQSLSLKNRSKVAERGVAAIALTMDGKGKLLTPPMVSLIGFDDEDSADTELNGLLIKLVIKSVGGLSSKELQDDAILQTVIQQTVRRELNMQFGKKPVTTVQIMRVG